MHAYKLRDQNELRKKPKPACAAKPSGFALAWRPPCRPRQQPLAAPGSDVLLADFAGPDHPLGLGKSERSRLMKPLAWKLGLCLALAASLVGRASVPDKQPPAASVKVDSAAHLEPAEEAPLSNLEDGPAQIKAYPESVDPSHEIVSEQTANSGTPAVLLGPAENEPIEGLVAPAEESADVYDPWERFNRRMHRFNYVVDRSVARPVANFYVKVVPGPVRSRVGSFFDNLGQPAIAVNALLQGKVKHSAQAMGRFLVNSTVGIAGLFDPASRMKIPEREEDFGQTLATWGWRRSRYLELPFFGPSTVRDAFGIAGDTPLQPVSYVEADKVRIGLTALNLVDMRTRLMAFDSLRDGASDDYLLVRDTWSQRRNFQIKGDTDGDASLPDYLKERMSR